MRDIFVFGSNLQGRHGKGAALHAVKHWGALQGQGSGIQGNAYALPTKHTPWRFFSLREARNHIDIFLTHAAAHPDCRFLLTKVGCGLAGFSEADISPLFREAPENVVMVDDDGVPGVPARDWWQTPSALQAVRLYNHDTL